jgi:hypothetical protein
MFKALTELASGRVHSNLLGRRARRPSTLHFRRAVAGSDQLEVAHTLSQTSPRTCSVKTLAHGR